MSASVDPAKVSAVGDILKDVKKSLAERYRALFTLRNVGGQTAIDCIAACFQDESALLKHELAYCLGQMQDSYAIPVLVSVLKDVNQEPMVRHEAGECVKPIGTSFAR
jgi:deoxyhypusine monooxygenase